ncbi:hypothetical protein B0T18DRAFT_485558 [Schizothecium vesticola]|uniref:Uncharacterized protein n=1 Tax=Schizothecium vesticola TaxID=314040 RepID=A0AA40F3Z1_9PEZI|nr:hypothetical protein B0T18DRAFT_485558 [Schizothecium vesticola]
MVQLAIATIVLMALGAMVSAAPSPAPFTFSGWVEELIANPNGNQLTPKQALVAAEDVANARAMVTISDGPGPPIPDEGTKRHLRSSASLFTISTKYFNAPAALLLILASMAGRPLERRKTRRSGGGIGGQVGEEPEGGDEFVVIAGAPPKEGAGRNASLSPGRRSEGRDKASQIPARERQGPKTTFREGVTSDMAAALTTSSHRMCLSPHKSTGLSDSTSSRPAKSTAERRSCWIRTRSFPSSVSSRNSHDKTYSPHPPHSFRMYLNSSRVRTCRDVALRIYDSFSTVSSWLMHTASIQMVTAPNRFRIRRSASAQFVEISSLTLWGNMRGEPGPVGKMRDAKVACERCFILGPRKRVEVEDSDGPRAGGYR